jgi:uncharacterized protein
LAANAVELDRRAGHRVVRDAEGGGVDGELDIATAHEERAAQGGRGDRDVVLLAAHRAAGEPEREAAADAALRRRGVRAIGAHAEQQRDRGERRGRGDPRLAHGPADGHRRLLRPRCRPARPPPAGAPGHGTAAGRRRYGSAFTGHARTPRGGASEGSPGRRTGGAGTLYWASREQIRERSVQEMVIYGVSFDMVGKQPIVLLKTVDSNKFLPIWIGHPEAAAILMKLQGATTPRPMTHDLMVDMLGELEVRCTQVSVTELRDNTFFASITLAVNGREMEIDSRPSDALALAVRSGAPIYAAEDVIAESAIEFEHEVEDTEEVVDRFKEFLDQVTPEDFKGDG